ncbi:succinate dehydrogenase assembly factor 3, mitochondrial-like [Branchiostoma floridae]|uniref:Succinate dehydrogenase assembly factor 3 n=1 Tax=Branchiostoma floridae TaxID=7739 RepID=A0A9J7MCD5_BRAFL|nr:succinate dehydrogenase assembly factor 3, mitochondrial-like [Branchiostoma floridae]XP_035698318.1 succinate dehydrogenase assembly factor 3, mitochondrial-like [Branchiostoma floridae]
MSSVRHVREVQTLYRQILRLHRRLPTHFRAIGDQYTKDEFHRHKKAGAAEVQTFMREWKNYAKMLQEQLAKDEAAPVGESLPPEKIENFTDEQLGQLFELQQETTKPISEELQDLIEDDKKR